MKKKQYQRPTMLVVKIFGKDVLMGAGSLPDARETLHRQSEWEE